MKKVFKNFAIIWAVLFVVYNIVLFTVRPLAGFTINYDARFWLSWLFVVLAFVGQLVCGYYSFKEERLNKVFLNVSIVSLAYRSLIIMTIASVVLMLIPDCPLWIATIVCVVVFGFSIITIIKAKTAIDLVDDVDYKVKAKTSFLKLLTANIEILINKNTNNEYEKVLQDLYDKVKYSDPMSCEELQAIEFDINSKFGELKTSFDNNDNINDQVQQLISLLDERNVKCKLLK